ncbi:MAG TPA: M48 family metallopeptidase, partial [Burkholderiaceae bacterium]
MRTKLVIAGVVAMLSAVAVADGVDVGKKSVFTKFSAIPPERLEAAAAQQYRQMLAPSKTQGAPLPASDAQVQRVRDIAKRLIAFTPPWNERAKTWKWEVNLLPSAQVNAYCMPGGKIAVYTGLSAGLKLSDDELAMVMGHEIAHALREHASERMGKQNATSLGVGLAAALFGLGDLGRVAADMGSQLVLMRYGREDESEADLVGMELAARAGYDPRAGITLWQKMGAASKGAPPQWLSTHPAGKTRIKDIEANLPKVMGLYERA